MSQKLLQLQQLLLQLQLSVLKRLVQTKLNRIRMQKKRRRPKREWTRRWILRREMYGATSTLMRELAAEDPDEYHNTIRMSEAQFNELLARVKPKIQRRVTKMRLAIPAEVKLQVTLRFLAGGESLRHLGRHYRVPKPSISLFLPEVLEAIIAALAEYIQVSTTIFNVNVVYN